MRLQNIVLLISMFFIVLSCKTPFDTNSSSGDLFTLTAEVDTNRRIVDTLSVKLIWDEITLDTFKKIKITRLNKNRDPESYPIGTTENGWITIAIIEDEFVTSWIDTVRDDETFVYRVDYFNSENNYRRAESSITIPQTTHLTIPIDVMDVKTAVESYIIDSGDSVLLLPELHTTHAFSFFEKDVSLIGLGGADQTLLEYLVTYTESEKAIHDSAFIKINNGLIEGITIKNGWAYNGGGISASGNAIIKQCRIKNNYAGIWLNGGLGGGLYLSGRAKIINCLIDSNYAQNFGDGIFIDALAEDVEIINCTLANNNIYSNSHNVKILNTIIMDTQNKIEFSRHSQPTVSYSYVGNYWKNYNSTNVTGYLGFTDYNPLDITLLPNSVCIDTGNPDSAFNDPDGSRNDIGSYGGPLGDW